ncbi:hypothetical protein, partial [Serratia marcescens]|uniref:hypothetical protein n=1 Tax=Serratia marcescens TaxID=615 RepID=UPI0028129D6E
MFDELTEGAHQTEIEKLITQTEKLSIFNENDEDDEIEPNNHAQEFRQSGISNVVSVDTLNDRTKTGS